MNISIYFLRVILLGSREAMISRTFEIAVFTYVARRWKSEERSIWRMRESERSREKEREGERRRTGKGGVPTRESYLCAPTGDLG